MLSSRHRTKSRALHYEQEEELPLLPEAKLRKIGPKMTKPSKTLAQRLSLAYYRFGLITGSEMLDPWERALFSTFCDAWTHPNLGN